ncbi:2-oxoacid:acceptor oxidoreductase subunit alpha [Candidatus Micrarchaeota archaeon]|nr:2-oxoacid:acceptor oxidoreductase subunit alpha [Candidatus Micrarchaeota archaeon]
MSEFIWKIGGEAGFGIMGSGLMFSKIFTRSGYYAHSYSEYASLIRGGHNVSQVRISDKKRDCPEKHCDLLVAMDKFSIQAHMHTISKNGGIIYDGKEMDISDIKIREDINTYNVPLLEITNKFKGKILMRNTVAIGATLALLDYPLEYLENILKETFGRKGEEIVNMNLDVAKGGYDYIKENYDTSKYPFSLSPKEGESKIVFTGNEAIGAGAIKAGLKFYCAYPMTPASSVLHYIASKEYDHNIVVKHTEDEIAAINMVIGASYAGVRAMTATSGGGFALMTEAIGLAALSETPIVIALAQRTGPSTGMPTWTEQADLRFAIHASQGDFLRVVLAPGDVADAYNLIQKAFNLADKYQIPVIIMTDKFLSESAASVMEEELKSLPIERGKFITKDMESLSQGEKFKRYELIEDGVSPRPIPGVLGGEHVGTSYEHFENSFSTENFEMRVKQADKRAGKIRKLVEDLEPPMLHGPEDAELTLVCWGSHKPIVFEAVDRLNAEGVKVNALHFSYIHPIHPKTKEILSKCSKLVIVENNSTAQFGGYLKEHADARFNGSILRYDGRPLFPEEVYEHAKNILEGREKDVVVYDKDPVDYYSAALVE